MGHIRGMGAVALVFILLGCATAARQVQPIEGATHDFLQRWRWKDWTGVARYLPEENREPFLREMVADEDLHITDVRQESLEMTGEGGKAILRGAIEYYRLPSVSVKTVRFRQDWVWLEGDREHQGGWSLATPPPRLP